MPCKRKTPQWVVSDDWTSQDGTPSGPGKQVKVLGAFGSEQEAADFIGTLPDHLDGRYNLDGPADDAYMEVKHE